jgi:ribosomal protein L22
MATYNKKSVDKAIKRDTSIEPNEARLIHRLLRGRTTRPEVVYKKAVNILKGNAKC